jgi:hypothetical protein
MNMRKKTKRTSRLKISHTMLTVLIGSEQKKLSLYYY